MELKRTYWNGKAWARGVSSLVLAVWLGVVSGVALGADAGKIVFVAGDVRMDGRVIGEGAVVPEGAELATGADGYLYLKTVDNGFLILRPGSVVTVESYHVDADDPKKSRFKFSLNRGVARSISGEAVGKAPENFRFNTPVAAIGVRGTDFSVYADAGETRLVVFSGGVIVSGFGDACRPGGSGPCEGAGSQELFAGTLGVLQIQKEENIPRIVKDNRLSPDFVTPPRSDEPAVSGGGDDQAEQSSGVLPVDGEASSSDRAVSGRGISGASVSGRKSADRDLDLDAGEDVLISADQEIVDLDPLKQSRLQPVVWGRWQSISDDLPATVDIDDMEDIKSHYVIISNDYYIIWRNRENAMVTPLNGGMSFSLADSQAHMEGAFGQVVADVTDGNLDFDFDRKNFSTWIDLSALGQDHRLRADGSVSSNGVFEARPSTSGNMDVKGFLSESRGDVNASYIFQSVLPDGAKASGVTFWDKSP
jgi:hypothetical protein